MSACSFTRPFEFLGANTIAVGSQLSFIVGFNKWGNPSATSPLVTGVSPALKWTITDRAVALGVAFSTTVLFTVMF